MIQTFKAKYLNVNNIVGFIISVIAAYFLFPSNFDMGIYPLQPSEHLWHSLDPSWVSALNYVKSQGLCWGKDFVFTLGPLSYLITRVGIGQGKVDFLLFDLFYFINFVTIFFIAYSKSKNRLITTFLIIAIAIILPLYYGGLNSFILLAFLLFWIRYSLEKESHISYMFQTIILVLLFFIKFNTGLISFVLFFLALIYKLIFKKGKRIYLILYLLAPIITIYIVSGLLHVSIPDYIKYAFQIVGGYNDIMYLIRPFGEENLFAILLLILPIGIIIYKYFKIEKKEFYKKLFVLFLFSVSGYVLYKQSFVRADIHHIKEFFYGILLILFCVYDFHTKKNNKYINSVLCFLIIIPFYFVYKLDTDAFNIKEKSSKTRYVSGYKNFTETSGNHLFPNKNQFPERIKNRIGNSTIDSYPWNTQALLENKLNFYPRPVFQSYTAYTPELEELNFNHYNSEKAPKFMWYDFGSIDDRYPLFDEAKLNLVLTKNYKCVDTLVVNNRTTLLLEKTKNEKVKLKQTKEYAMYIDSPLIPQKGVYYKVFLYRNLWGDFTSIINHAPEISLTIVTKDGNTRDYKTSKGLLETGLFGIQHITNTNDLKLLMAESNKESRQIAAYYFKPKNKTYFKEKIRIIEYKITQ